MKFKYAVFVQGAFGVLTRVEEDKEFDTETDAWKYSFKNKNYSKQDEYVVLKVARKE